MVAGILISIATSYKLPLSTTYVTFMVVMGTSLADKAWGSESAVYRVSGVLNVIGGWFATAFGAFIAGVFIATFFSHKEDLEGKLSSFGFGFLIPIFFIHVGSSLPWEAFEKEGFILLASIIAGIMLMVRLLASSVFIPRCGFKNALLIGLSHAMPLTLLIAVATLAYHAKSIDQFNYEAFVLASLLEVIIAMVAIKWLSREPVDAQCHQATKEPH
jgi:Kef-type K+ transport system membrane component KefB